MKIVRMMKIWKGWYHREKYGRDKTGTISKKVWAHATDIAMTGMNMVLKIIWKSKRSINEWLKIVQIAKKWNTRNRYLGISNNYWLKHIFEETNIFDNFKRIRNDWELWTQQEHSKTNVNKSNRKSRCNNG